MDTITAMVTAGAVLWALKALGSLAWDGLVARLRRELVADMVSRGTVGSKASSSVDEDHS